MVPGPPSCPLPWEEEPALPRGRAELSPEVDGRAASANVPKRPACEPLVGAEKSGLHTPAASNPDAFNRPRSRQRGAEAAARAVGGMQVASYSCPRRTCAALINYRIAHWVIKGGRLS